MTHGLMMKHRNKGDFGCKLWCTKKESYFHIISGHGDFLSDAVYNNHKYDNLKVTDYPDYHLLGPSIMGFWK